MSVNRVLSVRYSITNTELFDQLFSNTTGILQIQLLISKESLQSSKTTHVCIKNPRKVFPFKVFPCLGSDFEQVVYTKDR